MLKIKLIGAGVIALALVYFTWSYVNRGYKIETLQTQVQAQADAIKYYEKLAKIDQETKEVHNEIKAAVERNDVNAIRLLYDALRKHQRTSKGKTPAPAHNGGTDRPGD